MDSNKENMPGDITIVQLLQNSQIPVMVASLVHAHHSRFRSTFLYLGHGEWSSYQEQQHSASPGKGLAAGPSTGHKRDE